MKNKLKITFIYLLSFFYFNLIAPVISGEVYIVLKIEDEIVTNLDVIKEKSYLIALNNSLSQINQNQLETLAKNSIIKEKIKKNTENYLNIFKDYPYIFNLGHGVLPEIKPETIEYIIKLVRNKK